MWGSEEKLSLNDFLVHHRFLLFLFLETFLEISTTLRILASECSPTRAGTNISTDVDLGLGDVHSLAVGAPVPYRAQMIALSIDVDIWFHVWFVCATASH